MDKTQYSEIQNIRSTLRLSGFTASSTFLTSSRPHSQNTKYNHFTSIPYKQGTSKKVRILNEAGVKVAKRPVRTIGHILSSEDPRKLAEKKLRSLIGVLL